MFKKRVPKQTKVRLSLFAAMGESVFDSVKESQKIVDRLEISAVLWHPVKTVVLHPFSEPIYYDEPQYSLPILK